MMADVPPTIAIGRLSRRQWAAAGHVLGWTIHGPQVSDYPGSYVVRPWIVPRPGDTSRPWPFIVDAPARSALIGPAWITEIVRLAFVGCLYPTLDEARASVASGLVLVPRDPADDPSVIESWL